MTYKISDVVHETKNRTVLRVSKGFEVYRKGVTAMTRCGIIGWGGQNGLDRAIAECGRRETALFPHLPCPICNGTEDCDHAVP